MEITKFKNDSLSCMVKGLLEPDPTRRWTAKQALMSDVFGSTFIPKIIWTGIERCNVSQNIIDMCENFESNKKITRWAAQTYLNRTGCSPHSAVELACKFFETDLFGVESEDYPEEEMLILKKMEYNLFI